ncbi:MAG: hypothetical protein R2883_05090 [Caldisericia bacterium]
MDIRGELESSVLIDVISLLSSIKISGTLTLEGEKIVDIYFREGLIIGGASDYEGDFMELIVSVESGNYYFSGTTVLPREHNYVINDSHDEFVHKITKKMQKPEVCLDIYQDEMEFELSRVLNLDALELDSAEWRVLAQLTEKKSVFVLRTALGWDCQTISKVLFDLENVNIVKRVRKEKTANIGVSLIKKIRSFLERLGG